MSDQLIDNPAKLHGLLVEAQIPVVSVSTSGRIDYSRNLTANEKTIVQSILDSYDPAATVDELRRQEYKKQGITFERMVYALWNKIVNNDVSEVEEIQLIMQQINNTIQ